MPSVISKLADLRETAVSAPERIRVGVKLARTSGLLWELTVPGVRALLRIVGTGSQSPSQLYRVYAEGSPSKPAVVFKDRVMSFGELDRRIDRLAAGLVRRGIGRGTSLVLMMRNRPEFIEMGAAASRVGAAAVAVSWRSTPSELEYLTSHSGAKGICFDADLWPTVERAVRALPAEIGQNLIAVGDRVPKAASYESVLCDLPAGARKFVPDEGADDDAAVVIYTSGTTGKPKGAVRKFPKDTMPSAFRFLIETPMRCDDVHLVTCPMFHSTAFGFLTLSHLLGAAVVIMEEFRPEAFLALVEKHRVSTTALVPTMLHRIMSLDPSILERYDTRSLRAIFSGGAPLPGPLATAVMDRFGDILFNFYGATETGLVTLAKPADLRAAPGTIGFAIPGNEIRLLDDAHRETTGIGELYVKNGLLVAGYHKDDEATRSSKVDGFFSVGDLARKDRDGRYFIEGRKRDMIISGGVNVYPAEIEAALEAHTEVAEVAVVGVPDAEWGERVRAFVVKKPGSALDEGVLKAWLRERLTGAKVPRDFVFLEALPRNPTGKVLKRELREAAPQSH